MRFLVHDSVADNVLIERSLTDSAWFDEIYLRYRDDVFRFVARRVHGIDAADLTGDVFARAFRLRSGFDLSRENARPWLFGIAYRIIGDHLRKGWVRRSRGPAIAAGWLGVQIDPAIDAVAAADVAQVRADLVAALGKLHRRDREPLLMVALDGLSYREVAKILGIPVGTVRSRIHRARVQLRELLPEAAQRMVEEDEL
ncbi:ECF RNA polymerase sigma factor SigE [bacterium BMS3Bbin01]|nr:ECF RNA polymerase sigma factor SigE [bacterium BMS3Bbin01]